MKKILAILLVGVMSVTAFGFNASAVEKTDAEIQQEKLGYILNSNKLRGRRNPVFMRVCGLSRGLLITI